MTGPFLLLSGTALLGAVIAGGRAPRLWLGLNTFAAIAILAAAGPILGGGAAWAWCAPWTLGGETPRFQLDAISAFFLVLLAVVGGAGALYSRDYWSDREHPESVVRGRIGWSGLLLAMEGLLIAGNGLQFLICWELFALCGFFLIVLENRRLAVRRAGWLYLAASHTGTLALFAFFTLLSARTGGWEIGPMRDDPSLAPLLWLAFLGFGLKAGLFPLHVWLPSAHGNAPSHVSAILSGVAIKMGIYGLVRFTGWLPAPPGAGWVLLALGVGSALFGIAFALAQSDVKRLLAYCSVENIGIICTGLGAALLARNADDAPWGRLVLAGALFHVWNHGAFKALLFFAAGSVLHATGTREISRLGGLWSRLPWTAGAFAIGALAVSGLPPLNGFASEWLVYLGLFDAATTHGPSSSAALPAVMLLALAGALALATFAKAGGLIFLGAPRTQAAQRAHEGGAWMRGPMIGLAGLCVIAGLLPGLLWPVLARVVAAWHPGWAGAAGPAPFSALGPRPLMLGLVLAGAAWLLTRTVRAGGSHRALTWDCGYAKPAARMQYTAGSFGALATRWFRWLLRPERTLRRPRGLFPSGARDLERTPETVLERGLDPLAKVLLRGVTIVRRLQHGGLQAYLLYVLAGVGLVAAVVFLGGKS